jgi:serine/threonine protein kinase
MQNCSGGSLAKKKGLVATSKNTAMIGVVKGVEYLHGKGVAHRDLKPSNVLFDGAGWARIGDFGSARTVEWGLTQTQLALTLQYAAPEVLNEEGATLASDIWSLGLVLYELLSGEPVLSAQTGPIRLIREMQSGVRPRVPKEASPGLSSMVARCWNADPKVCPTIEEMCDVFAGEKWKLVAGADSRKISECLRRFTPEDAVVEASLSDCVRSRRGDETVHYRRASWCEICMGEIR